jgi:hypothetical protein
MNDAKVQVKKGSLKKKYFLVAMLSHCFAQREDFKGAFLQKIKKDFMVNHKETF